MFTKLIVLLLLCLTAMSASNCSSKLYLPPPFEDCRVITSWSAQKEVDVGTCFCIDDELTEKNFDKLVEKAKNVYKQHPLQAQVVEYLLHNKEVIIKDKEYELPISYCRGYTAIPPVARKELTVWAEGNRMGRITCELGDGQ